MQRRNSDRRNGDPRRRRAMAMARGPESGRWGVFLVVFDGSKRRPAETIRAGLERFREKYGRDPQLCLVSEGEGPVADAPMATTPCRTVGAHHYFLGEFDESER